MLIGCVAKAQRTMGLYVATSTLLGYGLARLASMVLDGVPPDDLLGAAAIELLLGASAALALAGEVRGESKSLVR
jgi:hypothetical protein